MTTLMTQKEVLKALADRSVRFSIQGGKARIVRLDNDAVVFRVKNGLAGKMVDNGLLAYDGLYELTDKGERLASALSGNPDDAQDGQAS